MSCLSEITFQSHQFDDYVIISMRSHNGHEIFHFLETSRIGKIEGYQHAMGASIVRVYDRLESRIPRSIPQMHLHGLRKLRCLDK